MTTLKVGIASYEEMKSRTMRIARTMEGYELVRSEWGECGRIAPKVGYDRVELALTDGTA